MHAPLTEEKAAHTILSTCAGLRAGEKLLLAADSQSDPRLGPLLQTAKDLGLEVVQSGILGAVSREPPKEVAAQMLHCDVTLFCVNEQRTLLWGHSDAKVAACSKGGRVLFLTQELEATPNKEELLQIRDRAHHLGELLEKTKQVTLLTEERAELRLQLADRKALRLSSLLGAPGSWGAVPDYSEAAVAPLESASFGSLCVNGMIVGIGEVDAPVFLDFEGGRVVKITGQRAAKEFEKVLSNFDSSAKILCELGFGTNHLRKELRGEFDDKKALGTVHIALGDNHTFGGSNRSQLHVDCLVRNPKVYFDGKELELKSL